MARTLPRASAVDTARVLAGVVVPLIARGVIVRRPRAEALAERWDVDRRAVRTLQRLRRRYGPGPLRVPLPGRRLVLLLAPDDVHRVLAGTPEPFSPATAEKTAVLAHFQPHGVLISPPVERPDRRRFNEAVLDTGRAVHRGAEPMVAAIHEETDALVAEALAAGALTWDAYARSWWRVVRRVVLGDGARDDEALTDDLRRLRAAANWGPLRPQRSALRASFDARLRAHLDRAEAGSLAAWVARTPSSAATEPAQQVPQWLFAYDAGAWTSIRTLALLATHPEHLAAARAEADAAALTHGRAPAPLPYLRGCLLDTVRLWPTTPAILRETTGRTRFDAGPVPERTTVVAFAPLFHRDDEQIPSADRLDPSLWDGPRSADDWPLVPFSDGPAACPGRDLVVHTMTTVVARLVSELDLTLERAERLSPAAPLPGSLDPFGVRFVAAPRGGDRSAARW